MISRVTGLGLLVAGMCLAPLVSAVPASASARGGDEVDVANMRFSPGSKTTPLGGSVTWRFEDAMTHDATSTQGFFASGPKSSGDTFRHTFTSSGSYAYLCTLHPSMRGVVKVPVSATGSPRAGWNLRWSTAAGSAGTTFDIQVRKPGSSAWKPLRSDTTRPAARFNPSRSGTYAVRARTTDAQSSGWSPVRSLKIT